MREFGVPCRGAVCNLLLRWAKSDLLFVKASTVKIKLYDYYYRNYVIFVVC